MELTSAALLIYCIALVPIQLSFWSTCGGPSGGPLRGGAALNKAGGAAGRGHG